MNARSEMPGLTLPFAVVGAAAGWLSAELLDNPLFGVTPSHAEPLAAGCTAVIAAAVGAALTRRCAPREAWVEQGFVWVQLAVAVLLGGMVSGGVIGGLGFGNLEGATSGLLAGLGAGAAFLPVCVLVVAAARRAARARLGSLVADADRREMWGLMAMALAVTTCASLPDWLSGQAPVLPGGLAGLALGAMVALFACDLRARRQVLRAADASLAMELRDGEADQPGDPAPDLDFGLGDEIRARVARSAAAYRGRERTAALVLGSPDQAVQAVGRSLAKKGLGIAVVGAVVAAHCLAPEAPSSLVVHEIACDLGAMSECRVAASMMDEKGSARPGSRAWTLASRACEHPHRADGEACRHLARIVDREGPAGSTLTSREYRDRACLVGDVTSCRLLADELAYGDWRKRDRWRAATLLKVGCDHGDQTSCVEAPRLLEVVRGRGY